MLADTNGSITLSYPQGLDFNRCSHEEATKLYTASLDMSSGDSALEQLLCQVVMIMMCKELIEKALNHSWKNVKRKVMQRKGSEAKLEVCLKIA